MPAGETITNRIRKQAFELYFDLGWDTASIRKKLMPFLCVRTVQRMIREFRVTFSWEASACRSRGKARKLDRFALAAVGAMLEMDPTLYLSEVKGKLLKEHGVRVSASTICRGIHAPFGMEDWPSLYKCWRGEQCSAVHKSVWIGLDVSIWETLSTKTSW